MDLWIRSQDRDDLIKVYDIWIDDTNMVEQGYVSIMANSNFSFELGVYKTKDRALEVLDEIESFINKGCKQIKIDSEAHCTKEYYIYEMPKE